MLSDSIFVQGKRLRSNAISRCTPFPSFRLASIPFSRTKFSRSDLLIIPLFFFRGTARNRISRKVFFLPFQKLPSLRTTII